MNYEGLPCKRCGNIIKVYSLSGLCRECWNRNRHSGGTHWKYFCQRCGHPQPYIGICRACQNGNADRLVKYRTFLGRPEHRYIYELLKGEIPAGWIVHHLNGLKGDNRRENLVITSRSDHDTKSITTALKNRIRELELKYIKW